MVACIVFKIGAGLSSTKCRKASLEIGAPETHEFENEADFNPPTPKNKLLAF